MKKSVMAMPARIRTRRCFTQSSGARTRRRPSTLVEKLHLDARDLHEIVIFQRVRRRADGLAVDGGALRALHVGDEVPLRPARQHRDLHARLAERGEGLGELELLAGVAARKKLDRA